MAYGEDDSVPDINFIHRLHFLLETDGPLLGAVLSLSHYGSSNHQVRLTLVPNIVRICRMELYTIGNNRCGRPTHKHASLQSCSIILLAYPQNFKVVPEVLLQSGGLDGTLCSFGPILGFFLRLRESKLWKRRYVQILRLVRKGWWQWYRRRLPVYLHDADVDNLHWLSMVRLHG